MQPNYRSYITHTINEIPTGKAIFTDRIARDLSMRSGQSVQSCRAVVNLNLKRLTDAHQLERLQKGVYYRPQKTVFGTLKPPIDAVYTEMTTMQLGEVIGYVSGEAFLNSIGLTTLMPKHKEITTNKYRICVDPVAKITLRKPATTVTTQNHRYLQLLDAVGLLDKGYTDADNPDEILAEQVNEGGLDKLKLISLAKKHYPHKTLMRLLDIILEG